MDTRVKPEGPYAISFNHERMVYILASKKNDTLYIGVTNNLVRRIYEHREGMAQGFTSKYNVKRLVHFEEHQTIPLALQREKNLKHWVRKHKIALIEKSNPNWRDLWITITN